jgi:hypothetical protein
VIPKPARTRPRTECSSSTPCELFGAKPWPAQRLRFSLRKETLRLAPDKIASRHSATLQDHDIYGLAVTVVL